MNPASLDRIERTNLLLGVVAVVASGVLWGQVSAMLAAGAGAVLGSVNFWVVRRLGARAIQRIVAGAPPAEAGRLVAALMAKMLLLLALIWVAIGLLSLPAIPFTLGISGFVVSIALVGLGSAIAAGRDPETSSQDSPRTQ